MCTYKYFRFKIPGKIFKRFFERLELYKTTRKINNNDDDYIYIFLKLNFRGLKKKNFRSRVDDLYYQNFIIWRRRRRHHHHRHRLWQLVE